MKPVFSVVALGVLPVLLAAQPVIDASFTPQDGDMLTYTSGTYVPIPLSGENVLWDLSGIVPGTESTVHYVDPASTAYGDQYPTATVALDGGSIIQYMRSDATGLYVVGMYKDLGTQAIQLHYTDESLYLPYPCTYNTAFTDTSAYFYDYTGGTANGAGNSSYTADGFGTLILPYDTIYNVLKLTGTETVTESIPGTSVTTVAQQNYFFKPGVHVYVLSATALSQSFNGGPPQSGSNLFYLSEGFLNGVGEQAKQAIGVDAWPVPARDQLNVSYGLAGDHQVAIGLFDVTGRSVRSMQARTINSGVQSTTLDVKGLPAGIYLLKVTDDHGQSGSRKVVIE